MPRIVVEHQSGASARVRVGRHALIVDQPPDDGGWDLGPTPTELFVAGLQAYVFTILSAVYIAGAMEPEH